MITREAVAIEAARILDSNYKFSKPLTRRLGRVVGCGVVRIEIEGEEFNRPLDDFCNRNIIPMVNSLIGMLQEKGIKRLYVPKCSDMAIQHFGNSTVAFGIGELGEARGARSFSLDMCDSGSRQVMLYVEYPESVTRKRLKKQD